jgi:hypothetical protein
MTESLYRVVNKHMLTIFDECHIPIPMSHPIEGKKAALEWFIAMNGGLPKGDKSA